MQWICIGDVCKCCRGKVGVVTRIKNGVYYGKALDGSNWQSVRPTLVRKGQ